MLLAGDVGGTKILLGLHDPSAERPKPVLVHEYATLDFTSLDDVVDAFLREAKTDHIEAIVMGVAGPVNGLVARMANVPWPADASDLGARFDNCPVQLLNDLEAMAYSVPVLQREELAVLQEGVAVAGGNAAIIAAGTGLGEALLHNLNGRFVPSASEAGHADFAARTPREFAFVEQLIHAHGRAEYDRVVSGHGLVNLFHFTHDGASGPSTCEVVHQDDHAADFAAHISASALKGQCDHCVEALDMLVDAYGAETGNMALRFVATAGVYIGGGIAPKILPALQGGLFMDSFRAKDPMTDLLRTMPVSVILNQGAGLIGAAVRARQIRR